MKRFIIFISLYLLVFFTVVFFSYVHAEESYAHSEEEWTIDKFKTLTEGILEKVESNRFLETTQNLEKLNTKELFKLNIEIKSKLQKRNLKAIF